MERTQLYSVSKVNLSKDYTNYMNRGQKMVVIQKTVITHDQQVISGMDRGAIA